MFMSNRSAPPSLTSRETEILELMARGMTSKEIAQQASITPRTVERHIENSRLKIRARNRVHLISKAVAIGILTIEVGSEKASDRVPNPGHS